MKLEKNKIDQKCRSGSIKMTPEHQEDIYTLSSVIEVGDMVTSVTTRKIQIDGKTQHRVTLTLKIKVEAINVDLESSTIYLKGKTVLINEYVKLGSYHTIDITLGQPFSLEKDEWQEMSIRLLKEAAKPQLETAFVVFYEKECVVSIVTRSKISIVLKQEMKNKKFTNVIKTLEKYADKISLFVVASAFEIRNEFYKAVVNSKELKKIQSSFCVVKVPPECRGCSNSKVINTILTDKDLSKTFQGVQYIDDLREVDNFFVKFAKGSDLVCIGMESIREAMDYGALDRLMITDEKMRPNDVEKRREMELFCREIQGMNCKISIVPVAHFSGEKLKEMGGICGLLKFSYR
ncbi:pelota-like RNA-binding protein [Encephalitozoon intestinalis ATCC 50506]|uniref:Pelota-like RNA-binding protein n=1 Tax=Encephalitozoon intestinalis (strain ATCC 50506) TaxID=876142 RepID=E0S6D5_ENCIT|nr:pelota-like RNA-binding protein [Encephalitozoon intestinalis ATCC 50506]ADM11270.1 pelota-like RNA-binding protein [Encephalitozoon intestinalis ATCC 50506]UTX44938.1 pelota-like protein [Encephalitozoon intestinalis]